MKSNNLTDNEIQLQEWNSASSTPNILRLPTISRKDKSKSKSNPNQYNIKHNHKKRHYILAASESK